MPSNKTFEKIHNIRNENVALNENIDLSNHQQSITLIFSLMQILVELGV